MSARYFAVVAGTAVPRSGFRRRSREPVAVGFNQKEFSASAVVRWEYRSASTLFVVWTQGYSQDDHDEGPSMRRASAGTCSARGLTSSRAGVDQGLEQGGGQPGFVPVRRPSTLGDEHPVHVPAGVHPEDPSRFRLR